jgi:hypothetical protein
MSVKIRLVKVEINPGARPADDGALVHLAISCDNGAIPLSYLIRPFRSLDEATEEARKRLLAFAHELVSQAAGPILQNPGNP